MQGFYAHCPDGHTPIASACSQAGAGSSLVRDGSGFTYAASATPFGEASPHMDGTALAAPMAFGGPPPPTFGAPPVAAPAAPKPPFFVPAPMTGQASQAAAAPTHHTSSWAPPGAGAAPLPPQAPGPFGTSTPAGPTALARRSSSGTGLRLSGPGTAEAAGPLPKQPSAGPFAAASVPPRTSQPGSEQAGAADGEPGAPPFPVSTSALDHAGSGTGGVFGAAPKGRGSSGSGGPPSSVAPAAPAPVAPPAPPPAPASSGPSSFLQISGPPSISAGLNLLQQLAGPASSGLSAAAAPLAALTGAAASAVAGAVPGTGSAAQGPAVQQHASAAGSTGAQGKEGQATGSGPGSASGAFTPAPQGGPAGAGASGGTAVPAGAPGSGPGAQAGGAGSVPGGGSAREQQLSKLVDQLKERLRVSGHCCSLVSLPPQLLPHFIVSTQVHVSMKCQSVLSCPCPGSVSVRKRKEHNKV